MSTLFFDLDEIDDDEDDRDDAPDYEIDEPDDLYDALAVEIEEVFCPVCKSLIEDGVQCEFCGYVVGV